MNNKLNIFNIIVIVYNFLNAFTDYINGYISYLSILILCFNFFLSYKSIKENGKNTTEIICIFFEVLTAVILIISLF